MATMQQIDSGVIQALQRENQELQQELLIAQCEIDALKALVMAYKQFTLFDQPVLKSGRNEWHDVRNILHTKTRALLDELGGEGNDHEQSTSTTTGITVNHK